MQRIKNWKVACKGLKTWKVKSKGKKRRVRIEIQPRFKIQYPMKNRYINGIL